MKCLRSGWCGIREGELLALTPADFDFEKNTVTINKSYQRLNGSDVITSPKTEKSNRTILVPQFLMDEIRDYLKPDERMFTVTGSYLHREMDRGAKEAGVRRIRIHDIRHTYATLCLQNGDSIKTVQNALGHSTSAITLDLYAHVTNKMAKESADKLQAYLANIG